MYAQDVANSYSHSCGVYLDVGEVFPCCGDPPLQRPHTPVAVVCSYVEPCGASALPSQPFVFAHSVMLLTTMHLQGGYVGLGGGIYNRGDIVVDGESFFSGNRASVSCCCPGVSQPKRSTEHFNSFALMPVQTRVGAF